MKIRITYTDLNKAKKALVATGGDTAKVDAAASKAGIVLDDVAKIKEDLKKIK